MRLNKLKNERIESFSWRWNIYVKCEHRSDRSVEVGHMKLCLAIIDAPFCCFLDDSDIRCKMGSLHDYPRLSYTVPFALLTSTLQMDVDSGLTMNGRSSCMIYASARTEKILYMYVVFITVNERWCQICYWSATCLVVCHIHLTVSVCYAVR